MEGKKSCDPMAGVPAERDWSRNYSQGIARFYALFRSFDPATDPAGKFLEPLVPPGAAVLDIGAGLGTTAFALASRGAYVTALEPDAEMYAIQFARLAQRPELAGHVTPLPCAAGTPLPARFDLASCFSVVHLLEADERAALVRYAAGQLAPGGRLVLEMPVVSGARAAEAMQLKAARSFGSLRIEHHGADVPAGEGWWYTHWLFRELHGDAPVGETRRTFRWYAMPPDDTDALLRQAGMAVVEEYGGRDRSPFKPGESLVRLVVARRA